jgi:hypothetical protein
MLSHFWVAWPLEDLPETSDVGTSGVYGILFGAALVVLFDTFGVPICTYAEFVLSGSGELRFARFLMGGRDDF